MDGTLNNRRASDGRRGVSDSGPGVLAIIPRGEVIRNFVYSGCFSRVAEEAGLSLLSVDPGKGVADQIFEGCEQIYDLKEYDERWIVRIQRDLLDMAHGRWLWSEAARRRWSIRDLEAKTPREKLFRTVKKALCYPFASRRGLRLLSGMERWSSRVFSTTDDYIELLSEIRPSLVFNGSHVHSRNAIQAVQAAQWLEIPTATFVFSWDNLTSQGRISPPYDHYLVWNEQLKQQLLEIYGDIRPDQVSVTGTPQFDFHFRPEFRLERETFCREIGADPKRKIVLYSTGMAHHMPGEPEIVEEIADILREIEDERRPQLLVRVYAKDRTGRFEELKRRRRDILFPEVAWNEDWLTPRYEDSRMLVSTLMHADLGINVASTISLELCMFDKPVINVGYNPASVDASELDYAEYYSFDHYRPVVESGAVEVAGSREEMRESIISALEMPKVASRQRRELVNRLFGESLDGDSAGRVAGVLIELARLGN